MVVCEKKNKTSMVYATEIHSSLFGQGALRNRNGGMWEGKKKTKYKW